MSTITTTQTFDVREAREAVELAKAHLSDVGGNVTDYLSRADATLTSDDYIDLRSRALSAQDGAEPRTWPWLRLAAFCSVRGTASAWATR